MSASAWTLERTILLKNRRSEPLRILVLCGFFACVRPEIWGTYTRGFTIFRRAALQLTILDTPNENSFPFIECLFGEQWVTQGNFAD
jgi:hypothetical protein